MVTFWRSFAIATVAASLAAVRADELLLDAESFSNLGGWVVDQQSMDQLGSPYLMAHGLGEPVAPLTPPLQLTGVVVTDSWRFGWVTVALATAVQPSESVTVTV